MRKPGVVRVGTARDLAEHEAGFSANGTGEFSRDAAHGNVKLKGYSVGPGKLRGPRSLDELIAENIRELNKLRIKQREATGPERDKITKAIMIKGAFVMKLQE